MRLLVATCFALLLFGVPLAAGQLPQDKPATKYVAAATFVVAQASEIDDAAIVATIEDRAVAYGVDPDLLVRVAWCESRFNPFAVGDGGRSLGLFQLHQYGKQPTFWRYYDDIWDVWQQSDFAAWQFSIGEAKAWSCARLG